jgi:hypothetical protein
MILQDAGTPEAHARVKAQRAHPRRRSALLLDVNRRDSIELEISRCTTRRGAFAGYWSFGQHIPRFVDDQRSVYRLRR